MNIKQVKWSIVFFVCLFSSVTCKNVYINTSALSPCIGTTTCFFLEPALWTDGIVPDTNDTVYILNPPANTNLQFNYSLTLSALDLQGARLNLIDNAQLFVQNVSIDSSTISLVSESTMISTGYTNLFNGSSLVLMSAFGYVQTGSSFYVSKTSVISVLEGYIGLHSTQATFHGEITLASTVNLICTGTLVVENNTIVFENYPLINSAIFVNSTIVFRQGWQNAVSGTLTASSVYIHNNTLNQQSLPSLNVDAASTLYIRGVTFCSIGSINSAGTVYISTSSVSVTGALNSSLVLAGLVSLTTTNLTLGSVSFANGENNEPPYATIATEFLATLGNTNLPNGILRVTQYGHFTGAFGTLGSIILAGDVHVHHASLQAAGQISMQGSVNLQVPYSLYFNESMITTTNVSIGASSVFTAHHSSLYCDVYLAYNSAFHHHNSSYFGDFFNDGHISIQSNLSFNGNFTQRKDGILEFDNIDLVNHTSGLLSVAGAVTLDGTIAYSVAVEPTQKGKYQMPVVRASLVSGKFKSDPTNVGTKRNTLSSVSYSQDTVYLSFERIEQAHTEWWIWFLIAIGFVIVAALLVFYVIRRRRADYTLVPHTQ